MFHEYEDIFIIVIFYCQFKKKINICQHFCECYSLQTSKGGM